MYRVNYVPSSRVLRWVWAGVALIALVLVSALLVVVVDQSDDLDKVARDAAEAKSARADLRGAVDELSDALALANERLVKAGKTPVGQPPEVREIVGADRDDPESQQPETQDPELQDREQQEREQQESESQEREQQEAESQDAEVDDPEAQDDEVQDADPNDPDPDDPDPDDPETQDPEVQDPERDDPDPNSALQFTASDNCAPTEGQYVSDVGLDVVRGDGSVTFVLTCVTTPLPEPPGPPATPGP